RWAAITGAGVAFRTLSQSASVGNINGGLPVGYGATWSAAGRNTGEFLDWRAFGTAAQGGVNLSTSAWSDFQQVDGGTTWYMLFRFTQSSQTVYGWLSFTATIDGFGGSSSNYIQITGWGWDDSGSQIAAGFTHGGPRRRRAVRPGDRRRRPARSAQEPLSEHVFTITIVRPNLSESGRIWLSHGTPLRLPPLPFIRGGGIVVLEGVRGLQSASARSCLTDRRRRERLGGGPQRGGRSRRFPNESSMQPDDAGGRLRASKARSIRQPGSRLPPPMKSPNFSLAGKVALVTGSSTGLGKAMAFALGRAGAKVAFNYAHNGSRAEATRAEATFEAYRSEGLEGGLFRGDVVDEQDVPRLCRTIAKELGPIDILVVNATPEQPLKPIEEYDWAFHQSMLDFFVKSPRFRCCPT
ncbi:MAG: SDR family NAD(P)-dependent oxidoreductase, partial [Planctomycetota bacterium]